MVKNTRWNPSKFTTLSGKEHFLESEINDFGRDLFFEDKLNLYELYNGV